MNNYLIVALVKELIFEVLDENITDYDIDDLLLGCLIKMEEQDEVDVKSLVKDVLEDHTLHLFEGWREWEEY